MESLPRFLWQVPPELLQDGGVLGHDDEAGLPAREPLRVPPQPGRQPRGAGDLGAQRRGYTLVLRDT